MSVSDFLTALLHACLGFAAGNTLSRRASPAEGDADSSGPSTATAPAGLPAAQADELFERVRQISNGPRDRRAIVGVRCEAALVVEDETSRFGRAAPVTALLEVNHQLQEDLASVKAELESQQQQLATYMTAAFTDPLTGLGNRRRFDQELERRLDQWRETGNPVTLVLVDVDHFKSFNDEFGHQAGDVVLHDVAQILAASLRQMDVVARYGGEEFGLILPGTTLEEAGPVAERLRLAVSQQAFLHAGHELHVTVSVGMAEAAFSKDPEVLVTRADMALYAAKDAGRNRCCAHDGQACTAIEISPALNRRKTDSRQRIVPFRDGDFPDLKRLVDIECEEVWPLGFTFLSTQCPDYDRLLMALGEEPRLSYRAASIRHVRDISREASTLFRVTCQFTVPVEQLVEAIRN